MHIEGTKVFPKPEITNGIYYGLQVHMNVAIWDEHGTHAISHHNKERKDDRNFCFMR